MSDNVDPLSPALDPKIEQSPGFTRRVLLGLFIVGQLWFLISTNIIGGVQDMQEEIPEDLKTPIHRVAPDWPWKKGHAYELFALGLQTNRTWEQATGQFQKWSLFPQIGRDCVFPALALSWKADTQSAPHFGPAAALAMSQSPFDLLGIAQGAGLGASPGALPVERIVKSDNEPEDINAYVRWGLYRIRKVESNAIVYLLRHEGEDDITRLKRWKSQIENNVWRYRLLFHEYVKFRMGELEEREPTLNKNPPRQIVLMMCRYRVLEPKDHPQFWTGPDLVPLARWQPGVTWDRRFPLEWYDPETDRFQSFPKHDSSP